VHVPTLEAEAFQRFFQSCDIGSAAHGEVGLAAAAAVRFDKLTAGSFA